MKHEQTFVVTAATGNIGSKLVKILLDQGHNVIAISRDAMKSAPLKALGAEIRIGQMDDSQFLEEAFTGSDGVFALIPPEYGAESFRGRQNIVGDAIATAIKNSGVRKVVNLSSLGAEHSDGVGPIKGLYDQEQRLNRLSNLDLIHLRAAYFYENVFFGAGLVKQQGIFGTAVTAQTRFAHAATQDIADAAARLLAEPIKIGHRIVEVISEPATTMEDISHKLSQIVGKNIPYVAFPYDATRQALVQSGLSPDVADQFVELYDAMNKGLIHSNGLALTNGSGLGFDKFLDLSRAVFH